MNTPLLAEQLARSHREQLLREAEHYRRYASLNDTDRQPLLDGIAGALGSLLVRAGNWLMSAASRREQSALDI
jgi:hypothetical protein